MKRLSSIKLALIYCWTIAPPCGLGDGVIKYGRVDHRDVSSDCVVVDVMKKTYESNFV